MVQMKPADEKMFREFAIERFLRRVAKTKETPQIRNENLLAGEPMYYYCKHCGVCCDIIEEDWLFDPRETCSQCDGMLNHSRDLMIEALRQKAKNESQSQ